MKLQPLLEKLNRTVLLAIQQEVIETEDFDFTIVSDSLAIITRDSSKTKSEIDLNDKLSVDHVPHMLLMFCINDLRLSLFKRVKVGGWIFSLREVDGTQGLIVTARRKMITLQRYNINIAAALGGISIAGYLLGTTQTALSTFLERSYLSPDKIFELLSAMLNTAEASMK